MSKTKRVLEEIWERLESGMDDGYDRLMVDVLWQDVLRKPYVNKGDK